MATKLSDILNKESTGIMFPFSSSTSSTSVAPVSTTQQVYNTATNGIMTVQGKQYTGPDAIINYGSKEEGYPRNLKQIEKGMLPQFNQSTLPDVGKGTVETGTPTAPVTPPTEEVKTPEPVVDPCPTGFKLINGVCQRIQQQGGNDRPAPKGKTVTNGIIEGYERVPLTPGQTGAMNSRQMMELEKKYGADVASEIGLINQKYDRGAQIKEQDDGSYKVIAVSPTLAQALAEINVFSGLIEGLTKDAKGAASNIINILKGTKEAEVIEEPTKDSTQTTGTEDKKVGEAETKIVMAPELVSLNFGNFGIDAVDFGNLPRVGIQVSNQLDELNNVLKNNRDLRNNKVYSDRKKKLEKKQKDISKAIKENEAMDKFIQKNGEDKFAQEVDKKYAKSNYTSPVKDAANRWDKNNKQGKSTGYTNTKTNTFVKETKAQHVKRAARNAEEDPSRRGGRDSY